jgi:hypothetical protein
MKGAVNLLSLRNVWVYAPLPKLIFAVVATPHFIASRTNDINVSRYSLFHLLITHADVTPCDHRRRMLQKPLNKHDIVSVRVVD